MSDCTEKSLIFYLVQRIPRFSRTAFNISKYFSSGKSTIAGHLIYKCGSIDKQKNQTFESEDGKFQKESFNYAWLFDRSTSEREIGYTIDASLESFESAKFKFNIIDTPGRREFIKKMISRTSQADVGLLVVDASKGKNGSDIDCSKQTREHGLLAYMLGVKQMVVLINKMDDDSVIFSEDRWKLIRSEIATYLKKIGYKPMKIPFIPVSGLLGDNLSSKSMNMQWYGGQTLLEALNNVPTPKRPTNKPLRVPIQEVRIKEGIGVILVGRIESGLLKVGANVQFAPGGVRGIVERIEINFQIVSRAIPGEIASIVVKGISNIDLKNIRSGSVLSNCENYPTQEISTFKAQLVIINHPGKIFKGYSPILHCHTAHTPCTFLNIEEKLDQRTGKSVTRNPDSVQTGDVCIATIETKTPICIEQFKDYPRLGRFAVRDLEQTVAAGVVKTLIRPDIEDVL